MSATFDEPRVQPLLELHGVSKFFGGVRALHQVDLALHAGEVVALVGDNGAGKSTLVKVISGVEHPDAGEIRVGGEAVGLDTPRAAAAYGIRTVYQDLSLCDNLDAVRNLFLGQEIAGGVWLGKPLDRHRMEVEARRVLDSLSVRIRSLATPVGGLSGGQRQGIAICRALISDPRLVLLDEPTAALGRLPAGRGARSDRPAPRPGPRRTGHLPRSQGRPGGGRPSGRDAPGHQGRRVLAWRLQLQRAGRRDHGCS